MIQLNFDTFPELHTERLVLRRLSSADVADILALRGNAEAMRYIGRPLITTEEAALELIHRIENGLNSNQAIAWGITLKGEQQVIGTISFHVIDTAHYRAQLGYMLLPGCWRKGIVNEAVTEAINYGFEKIGLHSIEAHINPGNDASRQLLKKHGFVTEGYFKENFFFDGHFFDTEVLSLLEQNYRLKKDGL